MTQTTGTDPYGAPWESSTQAQKTSVMAVTALVLSLICFIPGLSVLALILGVAALLVISRSQGRVRGTGVAIAGLVIALIVSTVWIAIGVGAAQVFKIFKESVIAPATTSFKSLESGDLAGARKVLSPAANAEVTDEEWIAFRDAYQAELGKFKSSISSMTDFMDYGAVAQHMQAYQGRNDAIPLPVKFDKGVGLLVLEFDPASMGAGPGPNQPITARNLILISAAGKKIELNGPAGAASGGSDPTPEGDTTPPAPTEEKK